MDRIKSHIIKTTIEQPNYEWLFHSIVITIYFLYVFIPIVWMLIYEIKYYKGAGEDYWYYGKDYVKNKFIKISSGNNPTKK